jgi:tripartite ATP-independent transporter DctM subunit
VSVPTIAFLVILLLFALFFIGLEIGFSMALAGFIGYALITNVHAALNLAALDIFTVFSSYGYIVIPLFVLMGQIGASAGMSKSLYDFAYKFIGHIPGGLAIGTVVAATAFKAICGSSVATAATFATVAVPEMDRYGYDKRISCGTVATVGTLGVIMPPSVVLIIYGILTETSIGKLFLAGILPGLLIAFSFVVTLYGWCKINPSLGPKGERATWGERIKSLLPVIWVLGIFILVVGGLMTGLFVPTEAGSVGAFAVFILVAVKREINLKGLVESIMNSLRIASMMLILLAGATILGHFFAVTQMPYIIADWLSALPVHPIAIMIVIIFVFLLGGSIIEDLAFTVLAVPIFFPLAVKLGFDPLWFGVIVCVTNMIGIIIPPMAMNVFVVSGITKVPINTIYKGCYPYIVGMSLCLLILLFFPQISLWLPNLLIK